MDASLCGSSASCRCRNGRSACVLLLRRVMLHPAHRLDLSAQWIPTLPGGGAAGRSRALPDSHGVSWPSYAARTTKFQTLHSCEQAQVGSPFASSPQRGDVIRVVGELAHGTEHQVSSPHRGDIPKPTVAAHAAHPGYGSCALGKHQRCFTNRLRFGVLSYPVGVRNRLSCLPRVRLAVLPLRDPGLRWRAFAGVVG